MSNYNNILIVEDEIEYRELYRRILKDFEYILNFKETFEGAVEDLSKKNFDVVLTDLRMLGVFSGFKVSKQAKRINPKIPVIVITGYGSKEHAFEAMKNGAFDFIIKGEENFEKIMSIAIKNAIEFQKFYVSKSSMRQSENSIGMIATSSKMASIYDDIQTIIYLNEKKIVLVGENGTGKKLLAQTIHNQSKTGDEKILFVQCSNKDIFENPRDSFSNIVNFITFIDKQYFLSNEFQTIFFNDIPALSFEQQNILQEQFSLIDEQLDNGKHNLKRIIASSTIDFREDSRKIHLPINDYFSYFIEVPPLRNRKDAEDIALLAGNFLRRERKNHQVEIDNTALEFLNSYSFPGNIPELQSIIKIAAKNLKNGKVIRPIHFIDYFLPSTYPFRNKSRETLERKYLTKVYNNKFNVSDLITIFFELFNLDYRSLSGENQREKVVELILYCDRREERELLIKRSFEDRPETVFQYLNIFLQRDNI